MTIQMDKAALDRYITKGPDNSYNEWVEKVWDLIPESDITGDELDQNEQFFDDGMNLLSQAGEPRWQFPEPDFAAAVLIRRFKVLKNSPECKSWLDVAEKVKQRGY